MSFRIKDQAASLGPISVTVSDKRCYARTLRSLAVLPQPKPRQRADTDTACWGDTYNNTEGVPTDLLKTCPYIGPDVIACQQTYGKKIFLSIGGGNPNNYYIASNASGKKFAEFLWSAFGPVSATRRTVPRPWGNAVVDGFDFDTENILAPPAPRNYMTSGYVSMINHLKYDLFPTDTSKSYYISGAPQCPVPDGRSE